MSPLVQLGRTQIFYPLLGGESASAAREFASSRCAVIDDKNFLSLSPDDPSETLLHYMSTAFIPFPYICFLYVATYAVQGTDIKSFWPQKQS